MRVRTLSLLLLAALAAACQKGTPSESDKKGSASGTGSASASGTGTAGDKVTNVAPDATPTPDRDLDSKDILARTEVADAVSVKHVLISWKQLARAFRGHQDPRGAERDNAAAADLAEQVLSQLRTDPTKIDALIQQWSEDPGSLSGDAYDVTAGSGLVPEFKQLALRLKIDESGIVKTVYGYHVMERITPPPPDPLQSNDILARPPNKGEVFVQHIVISWKDTPLGKSGQANDRTMKREKADADKVAQEVLAKVAKGGDMKKLIAEYSDDPAAADTAAGVPINEQTRIMDEFKALALRLRMGEAGLVKTVYGWHVMKRIEPPPPPPPPPPDSLDSKDILKRKPVTDNAEVKHILLGWTEANTGSPPGSTRTRAELETLVKATMKRLKAGEKIDDLMKELSEDGGSAKAGTGYTVTPDAGLVQPFKDLSLRLKVGEFGAVKSQFGIHIIQRIK